MRENISVRQWQTLYRLGAFSGKDLAAQCSAGWYDWFCRDESLAGRLNQLGPELAQGAPDPQRHLPPKAKAPKRKEAER